MFDIHFYGNMPSDEVAYVWLWSVEKNKLQAMVVVGYQVVRMDK